jgi:hypothetical protein
MDVEPGLLEFFEDLAYTVTVTPGDLKARLADRDVDQGRVLRIRRIGGGADRDDDQPIISFQSMASETQAHPRAAHDLDNEVWERFLEVANGERAGWVAGFTIEDPTKTSGPVELPYPDPTTTVVESIYRFTTRQ